MKRLFVVVTCFASAAFAQAPTVVPTAIPRVSTLAGVVQGRLERDVAVFRGMPFAAAPVGALRWRAPEPAGPWPGVRQADAFGKACPQNRGASLDQAGDPGPVAEDCLFLNLWTPRADAAAKLPVMVWIHGGAFVIGAGSQSLYDGHALAARGAVVVTFNYRLGALGFFAHPALDIGADSPVNFGLLDQIAALRWVHDNIAAFGGDPGNVTIFGESSGAQSVLALFTSPPARGLFRRGIAQSPYGIPSHSRAAAAAKAVAVADALGLDGAKATPAQLRDIPADKLTTLPESLSLAPSPIVGDAVLPQPILAEFQAGREAPLPLVIGNNSADSSVIEAFGVDPAVLTGKLGAARVFVRPLYPRGLDDSTLGLEVARDVLFTAFARRIAYLHTAHAPTWRYYFDRVPASLRATRSGTPHGGEIADVFGVDDACGCLAAPLTDADRSASQRIGDAWFAFAVDGIPAIGADTPWPRDTRARGQLMEFGDTATLRPDFMKRRLNAFIGALGVLGFFADRR